MSTGSFYPFQTLSFCTLPGSDFLDFYRTTTSNYTEIVPSLVPAPTPLCLLSVFPQLQSLFFLYNLRYRLQRCSFYVRRDRYSRPGLVYRSRQLGVSSILVICSIQSPQPLWFRSLMVHRGPLVQIDFSFYKSEVTSPPLPQPPEFTQS